MSAIRRIRRYIRKVLFCRYTIKCHPGGWTVHGPRGNLDTWKEMGKRIFQWHEYANGKIFTSSSMAEKALERSIWQDGRSRKRNWNTEELRKRLNKQSYTVPPFRHSGDA